MIKDTLSLYHVFAGVGTVAGGTPVVLLTLSLLAVRVADVPVGDVGD